MPEERGLPFPEWMRDELAAREARYRSALRLLARLNVAINLGAGQSRLDRIAEEIPRELTTADLQVYRQLAEEERQRWLEGEAA